MVMSIGLKGAEWGGLCRISKRYPLDKSQNFADSLTSLRISDEVLQPSFEPSTRLNFDAAQTRTSQIYCKNNVDYILDFYPKYSEITQDDERVSGNYGVGLVNSQKFI